MMARGAATGGLWYLPRRLACAALMALVASCSTALGDDVPVYGCERGRPHYCFKYGQALCRKLNSHADAEAACAEWTQACVECQSAISNCFERTPEPVLQGSAECTACQTEMKACMDVIDKEYWPNRDEQR